MIYLLQGDDFLRKEKRAVIKTLLPRVSCFFENLSMLPKDTYCPIGTVEFVKEYCKLNGISLPTNDTYPEELSSFLKRNVWKDNFLNVLDTFFVKPIDTKTFTGAIKSDIEESIQEFELDQTVWVSDPVEFTQEFRFYIIDKEIVGYSRYDSGDSDTIEPNINIVKQMVESYIKQPIGYSIDVGLCNGETILVEVNDGWSLGLYLWGNMTEELYASLVTKRWQQILELNDE